MRRYSIARNPIEQLRERFGLGDAPAPAPGAFLPGDAHPLPLVARAPAAPYFRPLPGYEHPVLETPDAPSDSGSVDYTARQRAQLDTVPKGEVQEPISVYPAWESRLEGMRDFLAVLSSTNIDEGPTVPTPGTITMTSFTVPQGYTCFWKRFRFFIDPAPALMTPVNTLITLLVDGVIVPHYHNLPLGAFMLSPVDTFVIASEGRQLTLRVDITEGLGGVVTIVGARALLYGNLRPRTGESEWRDVGVRMPEPPPPPVAVIAPPATPPVRRAPPPVLSHEERGRGRGKGAGGSGGPTRKRP